MGKKYIAYGSNLNLQQMGLRCPTAKVVGTAMLDGFVLTFRGVATIEPDKGQVPVGVWDIEPRDEIALDRYEGYPHLYRKENVRVVCKGEEFDAMVYIMNTGSPQLPNKSYFNVIREGYMDTGLDTAYLYDALEDTQKRIEGKR